MAELSFRYGSMDCGKTTMLLQQTYDYTQGGIPYILIKPGKDSKGENNIVSRAGGTRRVDYMVDSDCSILEIVKNAERPFCVLVDEAQFLTPEQVDELYIIVKRLEIPVYAYGLRCDFQMNGFPGSTRLLQIADDNRQIETSCRLCFQRNATQNLRLENGLPVFEGAQVAIDGVGETTYVALCGSCYFFVRDEVEKNSKTLTYKQIAYNYKNR